MFFHVTQLTLLRLFFAHLRGDIMATILCEHIKASGIRCGSPALRGGRLCYYHRGISDALPPRNAFEGRSTHIKGRDTGILQVPLLEDAASIQMGYMQVIGAVTVGWLDVPRARVMLSLLNGAARNLARMQKEIGSFSRREAKLWRGRWGYRMRGNTDCLASHPEQHVGMRPLTPVLEEYYAPLVLEGYDWMARKAAPPDFPARREPIPDWETMFPSRKGPESA